MSGHQPEKQWTPAQWMWAELPSGLLHPDPSFLSSYSLSQPSPHRGIPQRLSHWKVTKEFTVGRGSSTDCSNPRSQAEITTSN